MVQPDLARPRNSSILNGYALIQRLFVTALTGVLLLGMLSPHRSQAQTPPAPDKVVATVNGAPIKESDLLIAEQDIGSQLQSVPDASRRDYLIRFVADLKLGAQAAEQAKLQDAPDFPQRVEYFRDKILLDDLMLKEGAKADTPEARKKLYDDTVTKLRANACCFERLSTASRKTRLIGLLGVMKSVERVELRMFSSAANSRSVA